MEKNMKRSFRKFLALCLTMLLATSGFGYTEPIDMEASDLSGLEIDMPLQGDDGPSGQGETPEEETGGLQLGDGVEGLLDPPQPLDGASLQLDVPAEVTLNAEVEGVTFAVTGILAPDTVLSVSRPEDETLAEAAARSTENLLERQVAHNIYCIELLDAAGERIVLDPLALPTVTVNVSESAVSMRRLITLYWTGVKPVNPSKRKEASFTRALRLTASASMLRTSSRRIPFPSMKSVTHSEMRPRSESF